MTAATEAKTSTQVYRVYMKATPQAIWDAITTPEWSARYGYGGLNEYELRPGGAYRAFASEAMKKAGAEMGFVTPDLIVDGEVVEADPPRRLVQTWRMLMDQDLAKEGFTRLTYEIEEGRGGVSKLTVIHDLEGAPKLAAMVSGQNEDEGAGGGWAWVLSDLKSLLETGARMDPAEEMNRG
jgi:uncharacterized protein YndB with AHSA1/START domain